MLSPVTKVIVLIAFVGLLCTSVYLTPMVPLGLQQQVALPNGSYLIDYFDELAEYGRAGPPVYFVVKEKLNYTQRINQNKLCGLGKGKDNMGCNQYSLVNYYSSEALLPDYTFLQGKLAPWIDSFFTWLSSDNCCPQCATTIPMNSLERPIYAADFYFYLDKFLKMVPSEACATAGSPFSHDVIVERDKKSNNITNIKATR